jgi:hypothetical protein
MNFIHALAIFLVLASPTNVPQVIQACSTTPQGSGKIAPKPNSSTPTKDMKSGSAIADNGYGYLIAPYTIAPDHDHYFRYRLDIDVDGSENAMLRHAIILEAIANSTVRKSLWRAILDPIGPCQFFRPQRVGDEIHAR